jgi:hypothetical protein
VLILELAHLGADLAALCFASFFGRFTLLWSKWCLSIALRSAALPVELLKLATLAHWLFLLLEFLGLFFGLVFIFF